MFLRGYKAYKVFPPLRLSPYPIHLISSVPQLSSSLSLRYPLSLFQSHSLLLPSISSLSSIPFISSLPSLLHLDPLLQLLCPFHISTSGPPSPRPVPHLHPTLPSLWRRLFSTLSVLWAIVSLSECWHWHVGVTVGDWHVSPGLWHRVSVSGVSVPLEDDGVVPSHTAQVSSSTGFHSPS